MKTGFNTKSEIPIYCKITLVWTILVLLTCVFLLSSCSVDYRILGHIDDYEHGDKELHESELICSIDTICYENELRIVVPGTDTTVILYDTIYDTICSIE